jgi:hypothetical protein
MKIIKIFEDFKKEDYYVEIDSLPSHFAIGVLDPKETKRLFNYLNNNTQLTHCKINYNSEITIIDENNNDIWILCAEDQYYYVRYDDGSKEPYGYYYRCDQFEGLLMLLKDKNVI